MKENKILIEENSLKGELLKCIITNIAKNKKYNDISPLLIESTIRNYVSFDCYVYNYLNTENLITGYISYKEENISKVLHFAIVKPIKLLV